MINALISMANHEKVNIFRFEEAVTENGSSRIAPVLKKKNLIVSIQTSGSVHSVGGMEIIKNVAGKTDKSVYIVYSPRYKMQLKDLLVRNDGIIYEVQNIEHNGKGTLLQHDKYYIVEYNNQKVLKDVKF